jgi:hypothetical protein
MPLTALSHKMPDWRAHHLRKLLYEVSILLAEP